MLRSIRTLPLVLGATVALQSGPSHLTTTTRAASYSESEAYRKSVIEAMTKSEYPLWNDKLPKPTVQVIRYKQLGLTCADPLSSAEFYKKLGFQQQGGKDAEILRMINSEGLELHLIKSDVPAPDGKNVLMDFPHLKPPGHTHASWKVPSVPGVKKYLEEQGVPLSGTRSTLAVFVRDPDRTTLEFERNDGKDEHQEEFVAEMIGWGRTLDHVGTRIRAPYERHLDWYATTFGFTELTKWYVPNVDPMKNFPPLITRSPSGCEINFIPNCSSKPPAAGEGAEGALTANGKLAPGILYVGVEIEGDWSVAFAKLKANGIDVTTDSEIVSAKKPWGDFPLGTRALCASGGAPTLLVRDLNGSLWRLIPTA